MLGVRNRSRLLQPFSGIKQFAEEFYAMLGPGEPVEQDGPVTIRSGGDEPALTITGDSPRRASSAPDLPPANPPQPARRARPIPGVEPAASPAPDWTPPARAGSAGEVSSHPPAPARRKPRLVVDGPADFGGPDPVRFSRPPEVFNPETGRFEVPAAFDYSATVPTDLALAPSPQVTIARVTGGKGGTWDAVLLPNGPEGGLGEAIEVEIPLIHEDEPAPVGLLIVGLSTYTATEGSSVTRYLYQPPVWME